MKPPMKLFSWANGRAVSSAVEHRFYTPGVGSSTLPPPTKDAQYYDRPASKDRSRCSRPDPQGRNLHALRDASGERLLKFGVYLNELWRQQLAQINPSLPRFYR
jgi:hypothetical protein